MKYNKENYIILHCRKREHNRIEILGIENFGKETKIKPIIDAINIENIIIYAREVTFNELEWYRNNDKLELKGLLKIDTFTNEGEIIIYGVRGNNRKVTYRPVKNEVVQLNHVA